MSDLAGKLRALRSQAGIRTPVLPASPARTVLPANLAQLLGVRRPASVRVAPTLARQLEGQDIAPGLKLTTHLTAWPPAPPTFDGAFAKVPQWVDPEQLVLFDTETTGLAGGTGTRAFMIGLADWHAGQFRVRQWLMTTLHAEAAMLAEVARCLRPDTVLVSYNGKCYDAPLLATRYRLARQASPLAGLAHIDLLHPVRRRWRSEWPNCRLATAERELLGVVREDDLPGAEAPAAWLAYLRGGSSDKLHRVGVHNAQDLRSLGGVLGRFAIPESPAP